MIFPITGTIRNTVKLAELDMKWQKRKQNMGKFPNQNLDPQIQQYKEDLARMRKSNEIAAINTKLKSGGTLTPEEMEYLRNNNPELYREYKEICAERDAYEKQLKNCKTKEEVQRLRVNKVNSLLSEAKSISSNPNIPEGKKVQLAEKLLKKVMGINCEHMEFVKSIQYKEMPTEEEKSEEMKEDSQIQIPAEETESPSEESDIGTEEGEHNIGSQDSDESGETPKGETDVPVKLPELTKAGEAAFIEAKVQIEDSMKRYGQNKKGYKK